VVSGGVEGLFYGGGLSLLGKQTLAIPVVAIFAFVVSLVVAKVIDMTFGFRIQREDEISGIDLAQHAETAYAEGVHGAPQKRPGLD
jgi:ammonium transporter, Amt family